MNNTPLPAGVEPSFWQQLMERITPSFSPVMHDRIQSFFQTVETFWDAFGVWILIGLGGGLFLWGIVFLFRRRQRSIERLWRLILFFLSKRQMMIPLVYTIAQRENLLSSKDLQTLLDIRAKSRTMPLRKNPHKRMKIEQEASEILFSFFQKMEQKKTSKSQKILQHIVEDFEFIDAKLVELQKLYNREAFQWNTKRNILPVRVLAYVFRFPSFQFFGKNI